jgi:transketolase
LEIEMAGEVNDKTIEQVDDAPDADFDAGFSQTPDATETPAVVEKEEVPAVVTPEPAKEDPFQAALNKATEEIRAEYGKKFDTAFGQMGSLKQTIDRISKENLPGQAQVSEEDFAELKAEFPELADMYIKGLNKALPKMRGGAVDESLLD